MPESRIRILPPEVAEKIAAGEVIERPASAVKELVENALDAGARRITVETEAGGKDLIRITDVGCGMTPDEACLAVQRHATSKIRETDDLFRIHTLGFRGEALPSIAAVSELEILTRTAGVAEGFRVVIEGGEGRSAEPAPASVGTTLTVRRLFFNVPVRARFLRSDSAEAGQITELVQRLALSAPHVTFRVVHDGREALLSPGSQDALNTVVAVLGRQIARDLLRLPPVGPDLPRVTGFIGRPTLTRANRSAELFYVNGRNVRSPLFYRALDEAFRASMPSGRYPVAVLFLEVAPETVDVNVHPSKYEVRFQDETRVMEVLLSAMRATLRAEVAPAAAPPELDMPSMPGVVREPQATWRPTPPSPVPPAVDTTDMPFARSVVNQPAGQPPPEYRYRWDRPADPAPEPAAPPPPPEIRIVDPAPQPGTEPEPEVEDAAELPLEAGPPDIAGLRFLGQAQELFLFAESEGQLWIIDQHVAHERILFDRLTAGTATETSEPLLIPATLQVDARTEVALTESLPTLADLGFDIEAFGPRQFRVRAVPRSLLGRNYEQALRDMVDELADLSRGGTVRLRREQVAQAAAGRACKAAVKAGQCLTPEEAERLLHDLRASRNPYTCPHGRPVFLIFREEDVATMFSEASCER